MKRNLLLAFSLLLSTVTAGDLDRILGKSNIILMPQGFVLGTINSAGFSHLLNYQTANSGAVNPASLNQFKENAFGFSYQFDTKVDPADFVDITHSRKLTAIPQSVSYVGQNDNISYAASFYQRYNSDTKFEEIEITTVEQPQGTGETFSMMSGRYIDTYSVSCAYAFDERKELTAGARVDLNILSMKDEIYHSKMSEDYSAFSGAVGFKYQPDETYTYGIYYERAPKFEGEIKFDTSVDIVLDPVLQGNNSTIALLPELSFKCIIPDLLNTAASIRLNETFTSVTDLNYIFWEQINDNFRNNLDISSSLIAELESNLMLSAGFLLTDRDYKNDNFGANSKSNALFLLGGVRKRFDILVFDAALASSHFNSGKWREQLIAKLGIDIYL